MIKSFKNLATEDIFNGKNSKLARKICPQNLWQIARRKLEQLDSIISLNELKIPLGNQLESLKGDRNGQYSIRINQQYRICFIWQNNHIWEVEIIDYH
ncbi:type II toxin-antitoxin system RelE/ParE family toxin [Geminocystis sp. CENA526]|uniref:type II toxin-antitoxin system RelE/ParE family toxin n=1 Tax=Geminocystis sp. CENA526 TaxID=1355871 RepID=UPI003D6DBD35